MSANPAELANALKLHQSGQLTQAEELYRRILHTHPGCADAWHLLGLIAHQRGQHGEAVATIDQAIRLDAANALFHYHRGIALRVLGRFDDALESATQATRLQPNWPEAFVNLGFVRTGQGRQEEAIAAYQQALRLNPRHVEAHFNLGIAHAALGQNEQAAVSFRNAARERPGLADAHFNLGLALFGLGRTAEAEQALREAVRLRSDWPEAHYNLGVVLSAANQVDLAMDALRKALHLKPDYVDAHVNLGIALRKTGRLDEAIECYRNALRCKPDHAEAYNNLGNALLDKVNLADADEVRLKPNGPEAHGNLANVLNIRERLEDAAARFRQALELKPEWAEGHHNLGIALRIQGKLDQALARCTRAIELRPDYAEARMHRGMLYLLRGQWAEGWPEYEWRWRCADTPLPSFPGVRWDGSPLAGKTILLHREQGFGDTIQFIRYAALLKERGARTLTVCQQKLLPLLSTCPGIDQIVAEGEKLPPFDFWALLMSLPGLVGTTPTTIPGPVPYLFAEPGRVEKWRGKVAAHSGYRIGIAWQGDRKYRWDRQRSIPLARFGPLARVPGVRLLSLQTGLGSEQLASVDFPVVDLASELDLEGGAFLDTAAVMKHLDLVISADTSIAHLAGALGAPAWLALPFAHEWRWLQDRDDTPWYPTMRLFRQPCLGDWEAVFEQMAGNLRKVV
jgi:tetratricopeptide (TPR) repeat protein